MPLPKADSMDKENSATRQPSGLPDPLPSKLARADSDLGTLHRAKRQKSDPKEVATKEGTTEAARKVNPKEEDAPVPTPPPAKPAAATLGAGKPAKNQESGGKGGKGGGEGGGKGGKAAEAGVQAAKAVNPLWEAALKLPEESVQAVLAHVRGNTEAYLNGAWRRSPGEWGVTD